MNGRLDHVMMRVYDLEESLDWYKTHLDYEEKGRWEADTFTNVFLGPADVHEDGALLELTYNHDGREYTMGDAWGHIAVRVDDVYEAYDELMAAGVEDYRDPDSCGGSYAFVTDPDGHEIEIVERDHGARWSLDHTMVRVEDAAPEEMSVELTYNYDGRSYEMGDAWGHLAVVVDDLQDDWETLLTRDAEDYRDPESCDMNYAFTKDSQGHEIELVTRD